jgi:hypothetical protein
MKPESPLVGETPSLLSSLSILVIKIAGYLFVVALVVTVILFKWLSSFIAQAQRSTSSIHDLWRLFPSAGTDG